MDASSAVYYQKSSFMVWLMFHLQTVSILTFRISLAFSEFHPFITDRRLKMEKGYIQIIPATGKETIAALGLGLRAWGMV